MRVSTLLDHTSSEMADDPLPSRSPALLKMTPGPPEFAVTWNVSWGQTSTLGDVAVGKVTPPAAVPAAEKVNEPGAAPDHAVTVQ